MAILLILYRFKKGTNLFDGWVKILVRDYLLNTKNNIVWIQENDHFVRWLSNEWIEILVKNTATYVCNEYFQESDQSVRWLSSLTKNTRIFMPCADNCSVFIWTHVCVTNWAIHQIISRIPNSEFSLKYYNLDDH